jgi:hypothetical protein
VLAFTAVDAVPHTSGVVAPLVAAFFAFIIPVVMVGSLSQKDRPTGHGAAIAAWAAREAADTAAGWRHLGPVPVSSPAGLGELALAVAAGTPVPVPGASPGLAAGVRPGRAHAGKVTVSGAAACALPPDVLPRLATTIVGRLTGPDDRPPGPADRQPGGRRRPDHGPSRRDHPARADRPPGPPDQ